MLNISSQIGNKIKEYRNKAELSQETLASRADISTNFLGQIERGNKNPTIETLEKILNALDVSFSEFFYTYNPGINFIEQQMDNLINCNNKTYVYGYLDGIIDSYMTLLYKNKYNDKAYEQGRNRNSKDDLMSQFLDFSITLNKKVLKKLSLQGYRKGIEDRFNNIDYDECYNLAYKQAYKEIFDFYKNAQNIVSVSGFIDGIFAYKYSTKNFDDYEFYTSLFFKGYDGVKRIFKNLDKL